MGIPIGKLALYTAAAGIHPERCIPVSLDVGTNNAELLDDPLYVGYRAPRLRGAEYEDLVDEFVDAVSYVYPGALLQWEDFANTTSFRHLRTHRERIASFNDDIQGTAAMVVAGLITAFRHLGVYGRDQRIVIVGAGSAGHGIAEQIEFAMVADGTDAVDAHRAIYTLDSRGLVVQGASVPPLKAAFATDPAEVASWDDVGTPPSLLDVVRNVKPTVLIGVTGRAGLFTEEVVREIGADPQRVTQDYLRGKAEGDMDLGPIIQPMLRGGIRRDHLEAIPRERPFSQYQILVRALGIATPVRAR